MQIVDSQIHLWENVTMLPHTGHPGTYSMHHALQEMARRVDAAVIHPPSTLGEAAHVCRWSIPAPTPRTNSASRGISFFFF